MKASILALAALLFGAGCAPLDRRTPDDTLVVVVDTEVSETDPRYLRNATEKKISGLIAAGLTAVDADDLEPRLELAERIEQLDALTWEVTIRPDARFPDGSPVTADDVVYTYRSIMDPAMQSLSRRAFEERFAAVERLDDRRVRFRLKQPLATFLSDLDFGLVSRAHALADGRRGRWPDGRCVGAGPYRVVEVRHNRVLLERNEHWIGGPPPLRFVEIRTVRDANAQLLMLVGGSADLAQNIVRPDIVSDVATRPRLRIVSGRSAILTYLMFNNEDPILADPRVRRAIAHAIDREALVRAKFGGRAVLAAGLLPPGHWAHDPDVPRVAYDPERARRLLDEAGYPDPDGSGGRPRFRLTYKTSSQQFRVSLARLIAQQLGEIGIAVDVRPFEFNTFFTDIKRGNYQIATMQTAEIVEPDMYWVYFHSSRVPTPQMPDLGNRWRYRDEEVDRLIERGRVELDRARRKAIYGRLQHRLAEHMPVFPLWHEDNVAIMHHDVEGYVVPPNARLGGISRATKRPRAR